MTPASQPIALNCGVTYEEEPHGARRSVVLVRPDESNAATGRISVLSPVGRALLGQAPGARVGVDLPDGRKLSIRVLSTFPA